MPDIALTCLAAGGIMDRCRYVILTEMVTRTNMSTGALGPDFVVQEALKLPIADRVEVLHRLWNSLPPDSGASFFSAELIAELERRLAFEDAHPDDELTWDQVKAGVPRHP